jgi:predicted GTPase
MFAKEFAEAFASMGMFNLAVFGKTGSGKSTLINAIFGQDVASTGVGAPVTRGLMYYQHPDGFLGIYDSEGFETGTSGNAILAGLRSLIAADAAKPVAERIHAVWYLVRWSDRRFESAQEQFVRELAGMGLPVIIVLTQVPTRAGDIHPDALALADHINSLHLPVSPDGHVVLTNALVDQFSDSPVYGLQTLLDATYAVVPQAAERALTAAQVVVVSRKIKEVANESFKC